MQSVGYICNNRRIHCLSSEVTIAALMGTWWNESVYIVRVFVDYQNLIQGDTARNSLQGYAIKIVSSNTKKGNIKFAE